MTGDERELRALVEAYATAADAGDVEGFAALFLPGARLRTWPADGTTGSDYEGRDAIAAVPTRLRDAYDSTDHHVGDSVIDTDTDAEAMSGSATTSCEAHHVRAGVDRVLSIRYDDTFGRDTDGRWRFATRDVHVLAVHERVAGSS